MSVASMLRRIARLEADAGDAPEETRSTFVDPVTLERVGLKELLPFVTIGEARLGEFVCQMILWKDQAARHAETARLSGNVAEQDDDECDVPLRGDIPAAIAQSVLTMSIPDLQDVFQRSMIPALHRRRTDLSWPHRNDQRSEEIVWPIPYAFGDCL